VKRAIFVALLGLILCGCAAPQLRKQLAASHAEKMDIIVFYEKNMAEQDRRRAVAEAEAKRLQEVMHSQLLTEEEREKRLREDKCMEGRE
jgi:cell division protein FtsX